MALMLGDDETNNSMNELSSTPAMANNSFPPPTVDNASIPYSDNNSFPMPIVNDGSIPPSLQNHMSQDQFSLSEEANLRRLAQRASMVRQFQRQVSQVLVYSILPARHDNSLLPILNNASTLPGVVSPTSMEPQVFYGDWTHMDLLDVPAFGVELPPLPIAVPETFFHMSRDEFGDMSDDEFGDLVDHHISMRTLLSTLDNATVPSSSPR